MRGQSQAAHTACKLPSRSVAGALLPMPDIPEPDGHGWIKRADGGLDLDWIHGQVLMLYWSMPVQAEMCTR